MTAFKDRYNVTVCYQGHEVNASDVWRANDAAMAAFKAAGVIPADAVAAFRAQWAEFDCIDPMHGAALVYIAARSAADIALTEGWHNPEGAWVDGLDA